MNGDVQAAGGRMASEILEQPRRWMDFLDEQRRAVERAAALISRTAPDLFVFGARGSSRHATIFGQAFAQDHLGVPAMIANPSSVTTAHSRLRYPKSAFVTVSQSGESPDLVTMALSMRSAGISVVAITNNPLSSLALSADVHVDLCTGAERSVAATKTYTAELVALYALISTVAGERWTVIGDRVRRTSGLVARLLEREDRPETAAAQAVSAKPKALVVGRGYSLATAMETALKVMETGAIAASGWSAAEALHGPIGQIEEGTPVVSFMSDSRTRASVGALNTKVLQHGATLIQVSTGGHEEAQVLSDRMINVDLPRAPDPGTQPLIDVIFGQRLALNVARERGLDPDRPAALSKVTRTL